MVTRGTSWAYVAAVLFLSVVSTTTAKYSGGSGTAQDPFQIATAENLMLLGETPEDYDKHFILTADIDLDPNLPGRKVFDKAVIAPDINDANGDFDGTPFTGVFDGNGHTVSHLKIVGHSYLGLFGCATYPAEIRDLGVVDADVRGSGSSVGGLAGNSGGEGYLDWSGPVLTRCYSTGAVSGKQSIGGLVGGNWGTVTQCYSTGAVSGYDLVGGLVGSNSRSVAASFWDTQTSGQTVSSGGKGKTTVQMQTAKTFLDAGWDFVGETANGTEDIWWIDEGKDYPRLWWEAQN